MEPINPKRLKAANAVILDGQSLTIDDIIKVARGGAKAALSESAAAAVVDEWSKSDNAVYGITTGFGKLANVKISPQDRKKTPRKSFTESRLRNRESLFGRSNACRIQAFVQYNIEWERRKSTPILIHNCLHVSL